jgi:hypothetical protein
MKNETDFFACTPTLHFYSIKHFLLVVWILMSAEQMRMFKRLSSSEVLTFFVSMERLISRNGNVQNTFYFMSRKESKVQIWQFLRFWKKVFSLFGLIEFFILHETPLRIFNRN